MKYDILIVGGGIAGMESALTMADMGYTVLLVEKEASIGGKMVLLSKVFPTLDCASCISTPKMAATAHHPNVTILTYSEVKQIVPGEKSGFIVKLFRKPKFIDPDACTGCGECELACSVAMPDQFNFNLTARRAAYIPYPQAVPKKALIERYGSSPCSFSCPAGVKAHGYVSLVRAGKYEEAFHLHMEDAPLPGCLSRACFAPCEDNCSRGDLEGAIAIREIKRFIADRYYLAHPKPEEQQPEKLLDKNVAIVGSGPAGLSAAYYLARDGYRVTVFEAAAKAGGLLRYGIPDYRLPNHIVERDIMNVSSLGVEILTNTPVTFIRALKEQGFDAVFLALGSMETWKNPIPGEDLEGILDSMTFRKQVISGRKFNLRGKTVMVVGRGNVAVDSARVALRLGAKRVIVQFREVKDYRKYWGTKAESAEDWEVNGTVEENIDIQLLKTPKHFIGGNGQLEKVESVSLRLTKSDSNSNMELVPIEGSEEIISVDLVILAIGIRAGTLPFQKELDMNSDGTIRVNTETLETSMASVFAGGDGVTGPSSMPNAVGQGKRAAFYIDRFLQAKSDTDIIFDTRLPVVENDFVVARLKSISRREPLRQ